MTVGCWHTPAASSVGNNYYYISRIQIVTSGITKKYPKSVGRMDKRISRIDELQEIQQEIIRVFCREGRTLYEANLVTIWLSEQIDKLAQDRDPYESRLVQNEDEPDTKEVLEDDIIANSIQNIVNEILQDIGDIFISKKLSDYECEMVLAALIHHIMKKSQNDYKGQKI